MTYYILFVVFLIIIYYYGSKVEGGVNQVLAMPITKYAFIAYVLYVAYSSGIKEAVIFTVIVLIALKLLHMTILKEQFCGCTEAFVISTDGQVGQGGIATLYQTKQMPIEQSTDSAVRSGEASGTFSRAMPTTDTRIEDSYSWGDYNQGDQTLSDVNDDDDTDMAPYGALADLQTAIQDDDADIEYANDDINYDPYGVDEDMQYE